MLGHHPKFLAAAGNLYVIICIISCMLNNTVKELGTAL